ncbi:leucine-rich repeat, cysteine-containing subtype protein [Tanacetum coccineum]
MAPTKRKTKHKPQKTKVGEEVLDLVISYIHDVEDRNSVSLVSRMFYEIDGIMRRRLTVHPHYNPNPSRLSKRFPFVQTLTLKGTPSDIIHTYHNDIRITSWIEQLALEFRYLTELHMRHLVVHDEDLETLARTRGKDLRSLKIKKCKGFSTDGLMHVSKYCNQLRTLCLKYCYRIELKVAIWLHQLALNSTVLERFHVTNTDISYAEDLTLLAKKCCNSLISFKIGACYLIKLEDAFRYAVRLEHFGGYICDEERELVGFRFPPSMRSLCIKGFAVTRNSTVLPFLNQIRKLKLVFAHRDEDIQCLLLKRCPNLEVLYTQDVCGYRGLQVISQYCKKLSKLTHYGFVTHVGLIVVAKGCSNLKFLEVRLRYISDNEAIKCLGTHLKNLRKFRMHLIKTLESLDISMWHGGLTDVGLEYIGKYGHNLRFLSLTRTGKFDAGLVKLSEGCPKLKKLKLIDCPFSKQAVTSFVLNMPSLRYVWLHSSDRILLALTRPEFQH